MVSRMRLIDADTLKEELCKEYRHFDQRIKISSVFTLLRDAPTIDVVAVVRCKDCKQSYVIGSWDGKEPVRYCRRIRSAWAIYTDMRVEDDDFCSRGERKDG